MAAPATSSENKYYYRESKLLTSQSDSDSEDTYEVPPDLDSDSVDTDSPFWVWLLNRQAVDEVEICHSW